MKIKWKRIFWPMAIVAVVVLGALALRPKPLPVEVATIGVGPLQVTVPAEGKTRVHDRFIIAAPVSGKLERIMLHRGDQLVAGAVITRIEALPLDPLDPRQKATAEARLSAAQAAKQEADALTEKERAEYTQAQRNRERAERLVETGDIPKQEFEQLCSLETAAGQQLAAALSRAKAAAAEVEVARASLLSLETSRHEQAKTEIVPVRAPVSGRILKLYEESERVVTAGTPLIEVSNPSNLEMVIDVLSTDAVKIRPGAMVLIDRWGGENTLRGTVRSIEPSAFTKISALGVEEQRVNVIADFIERPESLGDGYHVETRIVIWESDHVLLVPLSALFRRQEGWGVFVVENGIARLREISIDHRGDREAEVTQGLASGESVILHPGNEITDGLRVIPR